jgi:large subunit ribosomal protein L18
MKKMTKTYTVPHRRRREQRTDYRLRLKLLKSGKPRLVIRKSANNIVCQIVKHNPNGDETLFTSSAIELKKIGWDRHCGNLPSAYLTGLLCGIKAKKNVNEAILDIGIYTSTKGSRLYATLKGFLDAGIAVNHSKDILPTEERIAGSHIEKHRKMEIQGKFNEIKKKILDMPVIENIKTKTKKTAG